MAEINDPVFIISEKEQWGGLSNFAFSKMEIDGKEWTTVEHYFQAQKSNSPIIQEQIRVYRTPKEAKMIGRKITLRPDWESIKIDVMRKALNVKYQIPKFRELLISTGSRDIYEDAPWDQFWGTGSLRKTEPGKNMLGKLLMEIRGEISGEKKPR